MNNEASVRWDNNSLDATLNGADAKAVMAITARPNIVNFNRIPVRCTPD
ncbi:MAG: hypothetical protein IJJ83_01040 [Muribaculaceae bacterium]|nr:hypothetical protein [Muribaculaceae bacterium]